MSRSTEDLAREMAERNSRCGYMEGDTICLLPEKHTKPHAFEAIDRVIPIYSPTRNDCV